MRDKTKRTWAEVCAEMYPHYEPDPFTEYLMEHDAVVCRVIAERLDREMREIAGCPTPATPNPPPAPSPPVA